MAVGLRKPELLNFEGNLETFRTGGRNIHRRHSLRKGRRTKARLFLNLTGRKAIEKEQSFVYASTENETVRVEAQAMGLSQEY